MLPKIIAGQWSGARIFTLTVFLCLKSFVHLKEQAERKIRKGAAWKFPSQSSGIIANQACLQTWHLKEKNVLGRIKVCEEHLSLCVCIIALYFYLHICEGLCVYKGRYDAYIDIYRYYTLLADYRILYSGQFDLQWTENLVWAHYFFFFCRYKEKLHQEDYPTYPAVTDSLCPSCQLNLPIFLVQSQLDTFTSYPL